MNRSWCILIAFFILSCGNNSTGPEIEPEPIPKPKTSDLIIDLPGGVKMAFIWIEPGPFGNGYYLGKYELTQRQWEQVMNTAHWHKRVGTDFTEPVYPAYNISWMDAQDFAKKLTTLQNDGIYRLPTFKEWIYACRAGTTTYWFFGSSSDSLNDYAWWGQNVDRAQIVGTKLPNPWGFYDIYGNVWEWVQDHRDAYPMGIWTYRIGGSYDTTFPGDVSSGGTHIFHYNARVPDVGVRILREGPKVSQP